MKGDWIMRKIKVTRATKSILLKALAPYYYRERALGHSTQESGIRKKQKEQHP